MRSSSRRSDITAFRTPPTPALETFPNAEPQHAILLYYSKSLPQIRSPLKIQALGVCCRDPRLTASNSLGLAMILASITGLIVRITLVL